MSTKQPDLSHPPRHDTGGPSASEIGRQRIAELAEEFIERFQRGERPALEEYTSKYPDLAEGIRELFPTLVMLEQLAPSSPQETPTTAGEKDTPTAAETPQSIGEYQILREIGRGGMGVVYEALEPSLSRRAAVKVLAPNYAQHSSAPERFRLEARAAAQLNHPHIVPVYEVGEDDGVLYYAMQFIRGASLDEVLHELTGIRKGTTIHEGPPPNSSTAAAVNPIDPDQSAHSSRTSPGGRSTIEAAIQLAEVDTEVGVGTDQNHQDWRPYFQNAAGIVHDAAQALAFAHQQGIVHRDIKPSNLLLDYQNHVWISDFGLAKAEGVKLTETGEFVGTLRYMAPERFQGWSDPRSDVYSLGATLYELLAFRPCFDGTDRMATIQQILHRDPVRLRVLNSDIPRDLETIVLKSLEKEPQHRYQTAGAMAEDLQRYVENRPLAAKRASRRERLWRWMRRNPVLAAALAVSSLLLIALTVGSFASSAIYRDIAGKERDAYHRALKSRKHAEGRLQQLYEAEGARREERGDLLGALPFYVEALKIAHANFWPVDNHQIRLKRLMKQAPQIEQAWFLPDAIFHTTTFSPNGKHIAAFPHPWFLQPRDHDWTRPQTAWLLPTAGGAAVTLEKHTSAIRNAAFSADGARLATAGHDGRVIVWNTATGQRLHPPFLHVAPVNAAVFSPDGTVLATACADKYARVFRVASGELLYALKHSGEVFDVRFDNEGRLLAVADSIGVHLWQEEQMQQSLRHPLGAYGVHFVANGKQLVTFGRDHVRFWTIPPGEMAFKLANQATVFRRSDLHDAMVDRDGRHVLMYTGEDLWAQLWDVQRKQPLSWHVRQQDRILFAAFHKNGKFFLSAGADHTARVWEAKSGQPVAAPLRHHQQVVSAAFGQQPFQLATSDASGVIRLWKLPTQTDLSPDLRVQHFKPVPTNPILKAAAFGSQGMHFITAAANSVRIWDGDGKLSSTMKFPQHVNYAVPSPEGARLLTSYSLHNWHGKKRKWNQVNVWSLTTGKPVLAAPLEFADDRVNTFAWSRRGCRFAVACRKEVTVVDAETGQPLDHKFVHDQIVDGLSFSADERFLVVNASNIAIPQAGQWVTRPQTEPLTPLSPKTRGNGGQKPRVDRPRASRRSLRNVRRVSPSGQVVVWNLNSGKRVKQLTPLRGVAGSAEFSPDGRFLVLTCVVQKSKWGGVEIWNWRRSELIAQFHHYDTVVSTDISPRGDQIATASLDGTARVWSFPGGNPITPLMRHESAVKSVLWDPSGDRLLTVCRDQAILWDNLTGRKLAVLPHAYPVIDASFHPSKTQILTASMDGQARMWRLSDHSSSLGQWSRISTLRSGLQIDTAGSTAPLSQEEFERAWRQANLSR